MDPFRHCQAVRMGGWMEFIALVLRKVAPPQPKKRKRSLIRNHRKAYYDGIGILSCTEFIEVRMDSGKNIDQIKKEWAKLPSAVGVGNQKHHEVLARKGLNPGAVGNRQKRHLIWTCVGEGRLPTTKEMTSLHTENTENVHAVLQ